MFRYLIRQYFMDMGSRATTPFKVIFSDGSSYQNRPEAPVVTLHFKKPIAERRAVLYGSEGIITGYENQDVDIDGDLIEFCLLQRFSGTSKTGYVNRLRNYLHELRYSNHSIIQAKKNALFHYNRGTKMFQQYLDATMTYTCAYWKPGTKSLDEAQQNKIEHVCKKLMLKPGETMIDIGGGWGSVLIHAFQKYGVLGTNVSPTPDQNQALKELLIEKGIADKIQIQEVDFREAVGVYDKYVSLGVYEHAGKDQLEAWIKAMAGNLKENGIGMLHFIGYTGTTGLEGTGIYIRKHVFPGGYLPGLDETIQIMAKYGLEVLDIENLRRHYVLTLTAWAENFDKHWETIHVLDPKKYDEKFRRTWRFYLYACAATFRNEWPDKNGLFQILFAKGKSHSFPMSREYMYDSGHEIPFAEYAKPISLGSKATEIT